MTDGAKACIKSQGKRRILKVTFVSKKSKREGGGGLCPRQMVTTDDNNRAE